MGLSFKENCPDIRNTKIIDMVQALKEYDLDIDIYDPWVDKAEAQTEYGLEPIGLPQQGQYDAIVIAVSHEQFKSMTRQDFDALAKEKYVLYDLKYVLEQSESDLRL